MANPDKDPTESRKKNTEEIKKLNQLLSKEASERKREKNLTRNDPASFRSYLKQQTIGRIDLMRMLPPGLQSALGVVSDIRSISKAKKLKKTLSGETSELDLADIEETDESSDVSETSERDIETVSTGFDESESADALMELVDLSEQQKELLFDILKINQKTLDLMIRDGELKRRKSLDDLENERESSRRKRSRSAGASMLDSGKSGDDEEGSWLMDLVKDYGGAALMSAFGLGGGASLLSRIRRTRTQTPGTRTKNTRSRNRQARNLRRQRTGGARPRGGGRFGAFIGAGLGTAALYDMISGEATESYEDPNTGIESNPYAGGIDPNLLTAAYGTEMAMSSMGLMNMGPNVTLPRTLNNARNAVNATRAVRGARSAMNAARGVRAVGMGLRGAAMAKHLAGGPIGIITLAADLAGQEYLARLEEDNAGMSESLAGGTRREGNRVFDVEGNPLAEFADVEGMETGKNKADAQKQNAVMEAQSKLDANRADIIHQITMASKSYEADEDSEGRIHLTAALDLLKQRQTYAANMVGILGLEPGSPEADSIYRLDPSGGADYGMKALLMEAKSKLWFTEWRDSGFMTDTLEALDAGTNNKQFIETADRRRRNFENSQRSMMGEPSIESPTRSRDAVLSDPPDSSISTTITNNNRDGDTINNVQQTTVTTVPEPPPNTMIRGTGFE